MSPTSLQSNPAAGLCAKLRTYLRTYPQWNFTPPRAQTADRLEMFGSEHAGYYLNASLVTDSSIVYSLGIGEDISFDLALIARFGASVEAFDPTPKVKNWLAAQPRPPQFHFHPQGIADHDGEEVFYVPPRKDWVSHSVIHARQYGSESVRLPVTRLSTAMRRLGHGRIDLLKMDIEGAEYAVIDEIVREGIPVTQLLVEFHHRLPSLGTEKTKNALSQLAAHGLKISYVCPRKEVFTLVKLG